MRPRAIVTASLTLFVAAGLALPPAASAAGPYSTLSIVSGDGQRVALGAAYAPLQVRTTDDAANPVAGVQVTYTVFVPTGSGTPASATFPGGATSAVVSSDASGLATAPTLTANNVAGSLEVDATTPDPAFQMKTFNLTNAAYSTLTKVAGDTQAVAAGAAFAPMQVKATDGAANPVAGVAVTYTIHPNSATGAGATFPGNAGSAVITSDANGLATAPTLTANGSGGTFTVDATTTSPAQTLTFSLTNVVPDTTPPTVSLSKPAANVTLSRYLPVAWAGADSGTGVESYDVRMRRGPWYGLLGGYNMIKSATTARSMTYTAPAGYIYGYDYCFSVRARDVAGNVSGWTIDRCTAIPLDDRSLVRSAGWKQLTGAAFFKGTMTQTSTVGSTLTRTGVRKGRMALVATRAPGFGAVSVFYNGKFVKKVSLAWPTTQRRHVFTLPSFTATTGKVVIKVVTAKRVQIDGLVAARL